MYRISGCLCTLGIKPKPIDLLIALAIRLWLTGLNPESFEPRIRPMGDIYSDMTEKFCLHVSRYPSLTACYASGKQRGAYPIMLLRIKIQHIKNIPLRLMSLLPLQHLHTAQIMRRIHISGLPASRNLLRQPGSHIMICQILVCIRGNFRPHPVFLDQLVPFSRALGEESLCVFDVGLVLWGVADGVLVEGDGISKSGC